ncbi:pilin [Patescibacteria group bacterium]|nr:pilin [Patescibacteria group bacterium]MBU4367557.1 pilin [Patescibacteria group bacterium]MBU4461598.1 pilin [Patescibacteria group bacterium]MCG2699495.1 pilin [Candidatus Parcubacteria bacterium]
MKKTFIIFILLFFLLIPLSITAQGEGIVKCGGEGQSMCTLNDLIGLPGVIIDWLLTIVAILAMLFITLGGIILLVSAGNPELKNTGKKILIAAIIGLVLSLGARAIINFILDTLGATTPRV